MLTNFTPQQRLQILPSESLIRKLKKQTPLKRAGSSVGLGLRKSKFYKNENYKYDESLENYPFINSNIQITRESATKCITPGSTATREKRHALPIDVLSTASQVRKVKQS